MDGAFEIARSSFSGGGAAAGQVLRQSVSKPACCNFIAKLDGPLPLSILGSSSWYKLEFESPFLWGAKALAYPDHQLFC